jgi:hypothetical protein
MLAAPGKCLGFSGDQRAKLRPSIQFSLCCFLFIFKILHRVKEEKREGDKEEYKGKKRRQLKPNDFISATEKLSDVTVCCLQQFGLVS